MDGRGAVAYAKGMIVYCVSIRVKPGTEDAFKKATLDNHRATRREMGNSRFDVLQNETDPQAFMLYEVYRSEEAAAAHKETSHYKKWRETVEPMMAGPREGVRFSAVAPAGEDGW